SFILDRHIFESHLADVARSYGAEVDVGIQVHYYPDKNGVGPSPEKVVTSDLVIASDGFPSETAAGAGLPEKEYANPYSVATNIHRQSNGSGRRCRNGYANERRRHSHGPHNWKIGWGSSGSIFREQGALVEL